MPHVRDGLGEFELAVLIPDLEFFRFLVADIEVNTHDPGRFAGRVALKNLALGLNPDPVALFVPHAELNLIARHFPADKTFELD